MELRTGTSIPGGKGARWIYLIAALLAGVWTLRLASEAQPHCFLDWVNLPFHEAGHLFFSPFGHFLYFLGGTLMQLLVPALLTGYFLARRSSFSASACLGWFGENLLNISVYMADARELKLQLVGGGEHDWNEIFYSLGWLGQDSVAGISGLTRLLGVVVMIAAAVWMACLALPEEARGSLATRLSRSFPPARLLLEKPE
jgi:hypothetical protein